MKMASLADLAAFQEVRQNSVMIANNSKRVRQSAELDLIREQRNRA